jgi:mycoredoxin
MVTDSRGDMTENGTITVYTSTYCGDCHRAKQFMRERGVKFEEINIDEDLAAEQLVYKVNDGLRKVPTLHVEDRYFACSPFNPYQLADQLKVPLNK